MICTTWECPRLNIAASFPSPKSNKGCSSLALILSPFTLSWVKINAFFLTYKCHVHSSPLTQYIQLSHFQPNAFLRAGHVEFNVKNINLARDFLGSAAVRALPGTPVSRGTQQCQGKSPWRCSCGEGCCKSEWPQMSYRAEGRLMGWVGKLRQGKFKHHPDPREGKIAPTLSKAWLKPAVPQRGKVRLCSVRRPQTKNLFIQDPPLYLVRWRVRGLGDIQCSSLW